VCKLPPERLPSVVLALVVLAGCATSGGVVTLADGRTGSFPILTKTLPTRPAMVEQPGTITADLSLPAGSGRVPAVIVLHSCTGVTPSVTEWARELNRMGYAALVLDSFTGRGVKEICTGHASVNPGSRLADLFRAQELLATHPRVDPQRIGVLAFSHGGWVALWASQAWYQRRFMRGTLAAPVAFAAFYPVGCNVRLVDEADVSGGAVRIFHGTADDWTTIDHCREWVARRRAAGKNVSIVEYEGDPALRPLIAAAEAAMLSARSRSLVTGSSAFCASRESSRCAFIRALARSIRNFAKSRTAASTGGHSFS